MFKLTLNRIVNWGIRVLFRSGYNDTTNAFKAYRREVIDTVQPLLSNHFNLTVEIPLKAIVRGHSYKVIPDLVAQPQGGRVEAVPSGDGEPVRVHRALRPARAAPESRRLQEVGNRDAWRSVARRRSKALRPEMTRRKWVVVACAIGVLLLALAYMLPSTVGKAFEMDEGAVNAYASACSTVPCRIATSSRSTGPGTCGSWPARSRSSARAWASSARSGFCTAWSSSSRCS